MVPFVIWVLMIALVYALMVGQSQGDALTGVVRISGQRLAVLAAQSALAEASYALRHPGSGKSTVLESIRGGSASGDAFDPVGTRQLYDTEVAAGRLKIESVQYAVSQRPAKPNALYQIDLTVRATATLAGKSFTRKLRRRMLGEICEVKAVLGPSKGKVVLATLAVQGRPLFEVVEP